MSKALCVASSGTGALSASFPGLAAPACTVTLWHRPRARVATRTRQLGVLAEIRKRYPCSCCASACVCTLTPAQEPWLLLRIWRTSFPTAWMSVTATTVVTPRVYCRPVLQSCPVSCRQLPMPMLLPLPLHKPPAMHVVDAGQPVISWMTCHGALTLAPAWVATVGTTAPTLRTTMMYTPCCLCAKSILWGSFNYQPAPRRHPLPLKQ